MGLPRCKNLTRFSLFVSFCFAVRYCLKCFCFLCFTSSVSSTGSYTEVKPDLFPKTKSFLIGIIYRPPDSSNHLCANFNCKFESMLSAVSSENKECLLTGDMNCNYLVNSDHKDLKTILASFGLKQLITSPTRIADPDNDIICSNVPQNIYSVKAISAGLSDHELIGCARKLNNVTNPRSLLVETTQTIIIIIITNF